MTPQEILNDFGHCTTVHKAKQIIQSHGGILSSQTTRERNGALVFRYAWELTPRRVNPIFVNGVGWLVPLNEVKP